MSYGVVLLEPLSLASPPHNPAVLLMWIMQDYALTTPPSITKKDTLQFNIIQGLSSAAAFYYESLITLKHLHSVLCDTHLNHLRISVGRPPTDYLAFSQMAADDITAVSPEEGPQFGLMPYIGFLGLTLTETTNLAQTSKANVIIAYKTMASAKPGIWWLQYLQARPALCIESKILFVSTDVTQWTSNYYRHTYLYPLLQIQCFAKDPILQTCTDTP
eukprot:12284692-Ditylum_brightwellii.AAC.1